MKVTVRKGDSLWGYSQLFVIPLQIIIDSNRQIGPILYIGQQVQIPGFKAKPYTIKKGDTYWGIATRYHLSVDALLLLNPTVEPNNMKIGEVINLPVRVTTRVVHGKKEYDFQAMMADLHELLDIYPFIISEPIGKSVMGKDIPEVRIGRGDKRVHIDGSFHANEWITTTIIMTFLNDYLLSLTNLNSIRGLKTLPYYNLVMISIVPMVNPDGVNLVLNGPPKEEPYHHQVLEINHGSHDFSGWKANIRGVDLNNQFPANWQIEKERKIPKAPAPRDYPGTAPLTEPEVIAMANLTKKRDFADVLAFHTQGEVIYWGYEGYEPPESEVIVKEFAKVSGYEPIRYVDSHAGYKDWFIQDFRRPGFTIELGEGENPLPLSQFDEIYEESLGIFLASMYM